MTAEEKGEARLLIVDDEPGNIRALERVLEHGGYRHVTSTTDPREALDLFRSAEPHLVLLDLAMPHLDGFQVMERIRGELDPDTYLPILVLTGQTDPEVRQRALNKGAKDFLNKPFELTEILARIANLLETGRLHRRLRRHNQLLEERVRDRTRDLEGAQVEILRRLAVAAEYRDDATGRHAERVGILAACLGRELGLDEGDVELLRRAAPLHDLGKIGIPDAILLKPDFLTPEEFEVMKTHTRIGAEMLSGGGFQLLEVAERVALHHHERWDGSGYQGLKGEEIPLVGRIVAVADVFDSLSHERPYKRAMSREETLEILYGGEGSEFDPGVIEVFRRLEEEGVVDDLEERAAAIHDGTDGSGR